MLSDSRITDDAGRKYKPHKAKELVASGYAVWMNEEHTQIHRLSELRDLNDLRELRSEDARKDRKAKESLAAAEVGGVVVEGIEQNLILAHRARLFAQGAPAY